MITRFASRPTNTDPDANPDGALLELLDAWTTSDDLRRRDAELSERFVARERLDSARLTAARVRSAA